jgi:hypothetical protein
MTHFKIREPWWQKKGLSVAVSKVSPGVNSIECTYKGKDKQRVYPGKFYFHSRIIPFCFKSEQKGVELATIPFDKLTKEKPNA